MNKINLSAVMVMMVGGSVFASITTTGFVDPASPADWSTAAVTYISTASGDGSVTVDNGSTVMANYTRVGYSAGATGGMTLNGSGTKWTATRLYLGTAGQGNLTVSGGAVLESGLIYAGEAAGSGSSITVSGSGSLLSASEYAFNVGIKGDVTMQILDGGAVKTLNGIDSYIGQTSSSGTQLVDVSGDGSRWDASGRMVIGRGTGTTGTLQIRENGLVSVAGELILGDYNNSFNGTGKILLSSGGQLALADAAGTGDDSIEDFLALITDNSVGDGGLYVAEKGTGNWLSVSEATEGVDYTLSAGTGDLAGYAVLSVPEPGTLSLVFFSSVTGVLFLRHWRR